MVTASGSFDWTTCPLEFRELRIAASFSGGVSLAVWMGGLTYELDRLLRASDAERQNRLTGQLGQPAAEEPRYAALLRLLGLDADVDVVTGTSAGGINGAALAFARVHGSSLAPLRDVWLDQGSFSTLLRPVAESAPPSLLQGDGVLLRGIERGLAEVQKAKMGEGRRTATTSPDGSSRTNALRLFVTATMTRPDVTVIRDSLGTAVHLEDNQALFRFEQPPGGHADTGDFNIPALARAARSSASYPVAFEPSFVPVGQPEGGVDMSPHLGIHSSRWMIDGGLRNNQPVGPALRAVWEQPANKRVRRVLLHIVPDPGRAVEEGTPATGPADAGAARTTPHVIAALGSTLSAPFIQSWRADLQASRLQARSARRRRQGAAAIHGLIADTGAQAWPALSRGLLGTQATWVAEDFVAALDAQLGRFATAGLGPTAAAPRFSSEVYGDVLARCTASARHHFDPPPPQANDAPLLALFGPDFFNACLSDLLASLRAARGPAEEVGRAAAELYATQQGGLGRAFEADLLTAFLKGRIGAVHDDVDVPAWVESLFDDWLAAAFPRPESTDLDEGSTARTLRLSWVALLDWIQRHHRMLPGTDPADGVVTMTLARGAATLLTLGGGSLSDQDVELVQMSARTRTLLSRLDEPSTKLLGVGMAHFGAFVRRSWRANDWMWGRLDGAGWLVHLLLTPDRLTDLAAALVPGGPPSQQVSAVLAAFRTVATMTADGAGSREDVGQYWDENVAAARSELAALFAADPSSPRPASFPELAMLVAYGLQLDVAAHELPLVADAMQTAEDGRGTAARAADRAFVAYVAENRTRPGGPLRPSAVPAAFEHYRVTDDTSAADLMTDSRLRSTAFDALAVASAAVDTATPANAPALPQATRAVRRSSRGLADAVRANSATGMASVALVLVGIVLLLMGTPWLSALGVPLVVGGLVSLALGGSTTARGWAVARQAVLVVGTVASVGLAWWVHRQIAGDLSRAADLADVSAQSALVFDNAAWLVPGVVGAAGVLLTWLASGAIAMIGRFTTRRR